MKRKQQIKCLIGGVTAALGLSSFGLFLYSNGTKLIHASNATNYSITMSSSNAVSEDSEVQLKTQLGNDVTFTYYRVTTPNSGDHTKIMEDGHITNNDNILSITSITAVFTGNLKVASSNSEGDFNSYSALTTGVEFTFDDSPYYIDLFADGGACYLTNAVIKFACAQNPAAEKVVYRRVTDSSEITSGNYMIVYENGNKVFNATSDLASNYISATITNHEIEYKDSLSNAVLAYNKDEGSLMNAQGKYIGHDVSSGTGNRIDFFDEPYANEISLSGFDAFVECGSYIIKYNANSGQTRFRYYNSSTQQLVQLYKATSNKSIYAKSISLSMDSSNLLIGENGQINVTYNPVNTSKRDITWTSSDSEVASVSSNGLVTANKVGDAVITASVKKAAGYAIDSITVHVSKIDVTGVSLNKSSLDLTTIDDPVTLVATITPSNATYKNVTWSSSKEEVATVENGVVTPVSEGETTITVASTDNPSATATCVVTVTKVIPPTIFTYDFQDKSWGTESNAWTSGKAGAGYSNGGVQVTAAASGANATTKDTFNKVQKVTVTYCTNTSSGAGSITVKIGSTAIDTKNVTSTGGTSGRDLVFTSDGTKSGTINITVTCSTNSIYVKSCKIECAPNEPTDPTGVAFENNELSLKAGASKQLSVVYTPSYANQNLDLTWDSSDKTVATVSSSGLVTVNNDAPVDSTTTITAKLSKFVAIPAASLTLTVTEDTPLQKTDIKHTYKEYNANNIYTLDSCPTTGSPKLLIVPVWFTNSSTYISNRNNVRDDIIKAYLGTTSETGWNSVKTFYETESAGAMSLTGVVTDWYECGKASTEFYTEDEGADATCDLVTSAVNWYFSGKSSSEKKAFDTDGNGYLDGVMLIYASPDHQAMSSAGDNMWAYCYWMQDDSKKNTNNPGPNVFFWASYDFMYDSSTSSSRTGKTSYNSGDCSNCNVDAHTFIHEMGHVLGLEDYYDYGNNNYSPAGGFSMQDYNVGGHDPYSVMAYGWADPYIPTESTTITIGDFQSTHDFILLTPEWNAYDSPFDEYLLLELYTPTGLNELDSTYTYAGTLKGPAVPGIRLWHVDARLLYVNQTSGNRYVYNKNNMTTNPSYSGSGVYGVTHAFANSYNSSSYGSPLGSAYYDYDILHLIRNNKSTILKTQSKLSSSDLFKQGDSFTFSDFSKQFPVIGTLNKGVSLGWSFTISALSSTSATIVLTKA